MVFHTRFKRRLPLLADGDLSSAEEERIRQHVAGCETCRSELGELMRLNRLMSEWSGPVIEESELLAARARLDSWLASSRQSHRIAFAGSQGIVFSRRYPAFATAALLIALLLGAISGRYLIPIEKDAQMAAVLRSGGETPLPDLNEVSLSNVQIIGGTRGSGEIEVVFDATRTLRLRGEVGEPLIQRVLARAIVGGGNPGIRMRAAASAMPRTNGPGDREIKAALLLAVKDDQNDGVRKAAIEALLRYPPDREIRDALVRVLLAEPNPGLRVAAVNGLSAMAAQGEFADPDLRGNLETHLRNEENLFVRTRTESLLKGRIQ